MLAEASNKVPEIRVRNENDAPLRRDGDFVLYWMIAFRRPEWNFSLQRAIDWAHELNKPLVVFEALRSDYPWASDRLHRFVIDGMVDNARRFKGTSALYYSYIESKKGAGKGLLEALAAKACLVVTDHYPAFFLPTMVAATARRLSVRVEAVDSNGLLPLRAAERVFETAYSFRRFLQKNLREHLSQFPKRHPLLATKLQRLGELPSSITGRWPDATASLLNDELTVAELPIDHGVPVSEIRGGSKAANDTLQRFLEGRLPRYAEDRNHPDEEVTSGLSPYLHFGHISSQQIFAELMEREDWDVDQLAPEAKGKRSGWWGLSESAEALLDQFITWREVGFNMSSLREDYDQYESLPDWAKTTLSEHERDDRPYLYELAELECAETHDPIWNAAQTQLLREGQLHNYLRMLWGKKILEWSPSPQDALEVMVELNNKYALDGRDPNSYSGIFWCLGRYDRPWGPERPIFGKIRYMSSENTKRKLRLSEYMEKYGR
jgi:deoxyribodipyrimidine photo-lyase